LLYWLLFVKLQHYFPPFRIFRYLTFRTAFASLTALFTGLIVGPHETTGRLPWWLIRIARGGSVLAPGDPDSPVSRGRLCPKGSASLQLTTGDSRQYQVLYRRPGGTGWESLDLDTAMDMIADRVINTRRKGWQEEYQGRRTRRTLGFASLGGATLDNEENYLIKKLFTALGAVQIENQARI